MRCLIGCGLYTVAFRVAPLLAAVWWPETGDGGDELTGGEPRA